MTMRSLGALLLCGVATLWLVGCEKPCAVTADCNAGDVCVAAVCRALSCTDTIFATDPATGACVPLSGCFLTPEQQQWQTCQADPCSGLGESACISDTRCQPAYLVPDREKTGTTSRSSFILCGGSDRVSAPALSINGDNELTAPGANTGDVPKHGGGWEPGCTVVSSRQFAGCRAAPQITTQAPCEKLNAAQCATRTDCGTAAFGSCIQLHVPPQSCDVPEEAACLLNADCQPTGTRCYCPPGATCDCTGGEFLFCEKNDHLRRCKSDAECGDNERCDNDEDCIKPRSFTTGTAVVLQPGDSSCVGACVPKGCAGLGEQRCNADPSCNAGDYATHCSLQYYSGSRGPTCNLDGDDASTFRCSCGSDFTGCADAKPVQDLRPERSLLVRDPEILDDPSFSALAVLRALAPAGQVDAFVHSLLDQLAAGKQVASGAKTLPREGIAKFYQKKLGGQSAGEAQRFTALLSTTALINRLDLATNRDCGEARLSFAMNTGYLDGNQRLTMIVELKVPDDGHGCQTVAQRWAELSLLDDPAVRRSRLLALYGELLKPEHLGQIRTNEFVNPSGSEAWELRELHLRSADGLLELAPVAQTLDPQQAAAGSPALLTWLRSNAEDLKAGTAIIPTQFLAGASTEDGARIKPSQMDRDFVPLDKPVNALACAGCHLTETKSPFVHIGERLGKLVAGSYRPAGRAVIDEFLQKELPKRAALLSRVLTGQAGLYAAEWRPERQARVH